MDRATPSTAFANTLHCALELSKKSWLLAIQFPDREQPSLYPIEGGNAEKLMAKLTAALGETKTSLKLIVGANWSGRGCAG